MSAGLFLGLTTVDLLFGVEHFPPEDSKTTAERYVACAGGPATNAAVIFARLGGRARLLSSLGCGEIARISAADLRTQGVEHHDLAADRAADPAISAIAINRSNGSRTIFTSPAIDARASFPVNAPLLAPFVADSDVLMLDGHEMELATEAARIARRADTPVVLDGDLYRDGIEGLLPFTDVAIFGKNFEMPGCKTVADTVLKLRTLGARHVVATQGSDPIVFASEGREGTVAVADVTAIDTLAAGDFFHGAFCFSYAAIPDVERSVRFAAGIATRSVTSWGPRAWLASL